MQGFALNAEHQVYYSTKESVPVADVIESLKGLERLIQLSPKALQALTGVEIDQVDVYVDRLEAGSLVEKVIVRLMFKDEAGLNAFLDKVRAKVGDGPIKSVLIGGVFAAILVYGMVLATKAGGGDTTTINASNNTIINIGAGEVSMTPEQFLALVEAAVPDKKEAAKAAVRMLKPARSDPGSSIVFDSNSALTISGEAIKATPTAVEVEPEETTDFVPQVEVLIRATNRDSTTAGWAARVPSRLKKKLKLELASGIDVDYVASRATVTADVSIVSRYNASSKKYVPERVVLLRIHDQQEQ